MCALDHIHTTAILLVRHTQGGKDLWKLVRQLCSNGEVVQTVDLCTPWMYKENWTQRSFL